MKISALISEFNPFHSGHRYLIDKIKENGATHIVAVMSGNFVQRGECAAFSKWDRAAAALENGVDLVIENPLIYATASAQRFAYGGINTTKALGCVDEIAFGSESGNIDELAQVSNIISSDAFFENAQKYLKQGYSFPKARELAINEKYGSAFADVLSSPNDILACEYISECKKAEFLTDFFAVKRVGVAHDDENVCGGFYSASSLRKLLKTNQKSDDRFFENARRNCKSYDFAKLEKAIIVRLRSFTAEDFRKLPDVCEGMENRLFSAVQSAKSLEELYDTVKTKRYTHSRIRRIYLSAFLGISKDDVTLPVSYVKVIGFNDKGRDVLKIAKEKASLPIVMKYSDVKKLDAAAQRIFEIESNATDVFVMACDDVEPCGKEKTENLVIIK